ncbi:TPA: PTS sugar transporter subunit IIB [Streptococcus pneumoniae]|uniref:PTS system galactitol-specific IIB component n=2 Tax=Streptococcus TaxID=1301 RepID=A0A4J1T530_STREE|nr:MULTISPECIES: PTS sugar transporter subunit IIB [Streptococcus]ETI87307.1 MAG: PTS system, Lactose/Cellobiose specific IIB subunit [Streptococcus anginosus DORA_7]MDU4548754.1 PTS sugar transporter subunit IIB [Clostridium botulinum]KAA9268135.1 PTS sugar transporter subunit IIB [Streptococcus anginosus]KAA9320192.1 PTS sugar transporter subunit IIB [Streptococcus anginosus]MCW1004577.1 PTS sugar transporter subunit IIB [Streptococcus anginosus]
MKKILVICGAGHATSTIAVSKIKKWLEDNNLDSDAKIYQSKIADELNKFDDYDVVVSTTVVPDSVKEKVINGVALLTGVGIDKVFEQIRKELEK